MSLVVILTGISIAVGLVAAALIYICILIGARSDEP